ncbi:MAG: transposase family protein [Bacteroidales bacterium]|nr:transposase family protein [Bacteroidales bacterium]
MSTSLLNHAFGLTDQEYLKTEYKEGTVIFHIKTKDSKLRCSSCGSRNIIKKGTVDRLFRTLPIGTRPVYLHAKVKTSCNTIEIWSDSTAEFSLTLFLI